MNNETKIGIFAVIVLGMFIWGYKFLEGRNILTTSKLVYVEFDQVNQLGASSPVLINGLQVGTVTDIYLSPENMKTIVATMTIDRGVEFPKTAIAENGSSVMGSAFIQLKFDQPCSGDNCVESGDYIQGRTLSMLESLIPQDEMGKYTSQISEGVEKGMDALNKKINDPSPENKIGQTLRDLQVTMENLKKTTDRMNLLLAANSSKIGGMLENMNSITGNLKDSNEEIKNILENTSQLTDQFDSIQIAQLMANTDAAISEATATMTALKKTMGTADKTMADINDITTKVKNGEGTIGLLVTDDALYHNLNRMSMQIDSFLFDLENYPYRYVPLKSRKKVKKYDRKDDRN